MKQTKITQEFISCPTFDFKSSRYRNSNKMSQWESQKPHIKSSIDHSESVQIEVMPK